MQIEPKASQESILNGRFGTLQRTLLNSFRTSVPLFSLSSLEGPVQLRRTNINE